MKKALLVGIDAYPTLPLRGCLNDINGWKTIFSSLGFKIEVLLNSAAKRAPILAAIDRLLTGAKSGDTLAFCYAGHGSKVKDRNGDESDGYDEVICPYDWPLYISDDDLRAKFAKIPAGVTLEVFLDSCYSGTATRGIDITTRCIPGPITNGKPAKRVVTTVPGLNHILWAGCKSSQTSGEIVVGGITRGIFSYYVQKAITKYPNLPRSELIAAVQSTVAAKIANQTPQLECIQAESLQKPFA